MDTLSFDSHGSTAYQQHFPASGGYATQSLRQQPTPESQQVCLKESRHVNRIDFCSLHHVAETVSLQSPRVVGSLPENSQSFGSQKITLSEDMDDPFIWPEPTQVLLHMLNVVRTIHYDRYGEFLSLHQNGLCDRLISLVRPEAWKVLQRRIFTRERNRSPCNLVFEIKIRIVCLKSPGNQAKLEFTFIFSGRRAGVSRHIPTSMLAKVLR